MKRFKLFFEYLLNKRLVEYEQIIKKATNLGYKFVSVTDFYNNTFAKDKKIIILRHDVDYPSKATATMLDIERKYNAKGSYYFRRISLNFPLMKRIQKYGSEASYHFETISNYAKKRGITSPKELKNFNWQKHCLKILKDDLNLIRAEGINISTISGHGDPWCSKIKKANYFLTYEKDAYKYLNIDLEVYNHDFLNLLDAYVSDDKPEFNDGWHYGKTVFDEIKKGKKRILLLVHPNHWYFKGIWRIRKLIKVLLYGSKNMQVPFDLY